MLRVWLIDGLIDELVDGQHRGNAPCANALRTSICASFAALYLLCAGLFCVPGPFDNHCDQPWIAPPDLSVGVLAYVATSAVRLDSLESKCLCLVLASAGVCRQSNVNKLQG